LGYLNPLSILHEVDFWSLSLSLTVVIFFFINKIYVFEDTLLAIYHEKQAFNMYNIMQLLDVNSQYLNPFFQVCMEQIKVKINGCIKIL